LFSKTQVIFSPFSGFENGGGEEGVCPTAYDPENLANSRELRHNQTEAEAKLWQALRAIKLVIFTFAANMRLEIMWLIVCAPRKKLIIEVRWRPAFGTGRIR